MEKENFEQTWVSLALHWWCAMRTSCIYWPIWRHIKRVQHQHKMFRNSKFNCRAAAQTASRLVTLHAIGHSTVFIDAIECDYVIFISTPNINVNKCLIWCDVGYMRADFAESQSMHVVFLSKRISVILCVFRSNWVEMRILVNKALGMRFNGEPWKWYCCLAPTYLQSNLT